MLRSIVQSMYCTKGEGNEIAHSFDGLADAVIENMHFRDELGLDSASKIEAKNDGRTGI